MRRFFPVYLTVMRLRSKDAELFCASFGLCERFARGCPPTQTPTQKFKNGFLIFSSQGIALRLVSLKMIFEALQSELLRFTFHLLSSKILKLPEFTLIISYNLYDKVRLKWFHSKGCVISALSPALVSKCKPPS